MNLQHAIGAPEHFLVISSARDLARDSHISRGMTPEEMCERTAAFAERVVELTNPLLDKAATHDFAVQLRRAAASVASNYEAAQRAKSHRDFTSKLNTVLEEAAESLFWLRFLRRCRLVSAAGVDPLIGEADQLVRIFKGGVRSARNRDEAESPRTRRRASSRQKPQCSP